MIALFITIPKSEGEESNVEKLDIPNISELIEDEIKRIEGENTAQELEERRKANIVSRGTIRSVPNTNTSMKSYMDYRKITSKISPQYKLQQRKDVHTDNEGFRRIGDKFIVAVGIYYSDSVGDCLSIELSTGRVFEAIVGDIKDNSHTDKMNRQHKVDGSVVEFIVDTKNMDKLAKKMGDVSYAEVADLKGDIVSIILINEYKIKD